MHGHGLPFLLCKELCWGPGPPPRHALGLLTGLLSLRGSYEGSLFLDKQPLALEIDTVLMVIWLLKAVSF